MTCGKGLLPLNNAFKTSNGRKPCPISGAALSPKGWSTTYVSSAKPSPKTQNKSPLPTGASFYCTWATGAVNGQQKSTKALHLLSKSRQSTEGHHQVLLNIRLIGTGGKHIKEELTYHQTQHYKRSTLECTSLQWPLSPRCCQP